MEESLRNGTGSHGEGVFGTDGDDTPEGPRILRDDNKCIYRYKIRGADHTYEIIPSTKINIDGSYIYHP